MSLPIIPGLKPSTMQAISISTPSDIDPISTIEYVTVPIPSTPAGHTAVKMAAVGLNFHDIFTMRGGLGNSWPRIIGCEGASTVTTPEGATSSVILYPCMSSSSWTGDESLDPERHVFSEQVEGTLAEYVVAPTENLIAKPEGMSMEIAGVLGVAWLTAWRMLFTCSGLKPGQTMLVQGASGGVTTALTQLGAAAGMVVSCVGRSESKRALARRLGATEVLAPGEKMKAGKADAVFDTSGTATWDASLGYVKIGGTIVLCGGHSGKTVALDASVIFINQITIRGCYLGSLQEFKDMIAFVEKKGVVPYIGQVLPLSETKKGFAAMWEGRTEGKIVVTM